MDSVARELCFDGIVTLATGFVLGTYMLSAFLDPVPAIGIGGLLLVIGTIILVPRAAWMPAGATGLVAMILAGITVPRYVVEATNVRGEMALVLGIGVIVLLLSFITIRVTAFRPQTA